MRWLRGALGLALVTALCALGYARLHAHAAPLSRDNPWSSLKRTFGEQPFVAQVEQKLAAGSYTYLALRSEQQALQWAVMLGSGPLPGTRVSVRSMGHKTNFRSRRLQRTFPDLMFAIVSRLD
jgi:hypothetical protein